MFIVFRQELNFIFITATDNCKPNPCMNDTVCNSSTQGYEFTCPSGYTGTNCEKGNYKYYLASIDVCKNLITLPVFPSNRY